MIASAFGILQKITALNPQLADFIFTRSNPKIPRLVGRERAVKTFKTASASVPAYKDFLKKSHIDPLVVEKFSDFETLVPLTDKASYIEKYPLADLCLGGEVASKFAIERSSGYSGKSHYWPRFPGQDDPILGFFEYLSYKNGWFAKDKKTMVLVCLGLGLWVGGIKSVWLYRVLANKGRFPVTVLTPGIDVLDILSAIKDLGQYFDQIFIISYPSLAKEIVERGIKEGIDWKRRPLSMLLCGEGFSENWRDYMAGLLGFKVGGLNLQRLVSLYATADIGAGSAYETPLSITVRRLAREDSALAQDLFGSVDNLPQLFQYSPAGSFLEVVNGELVFTSIGGIPVVRYNMHDRGGVIYFEEMVKSLSSHGYNIKEIMAKHGFGEKDVLPFDFCFIFGRSDGAATIYGAKVYVENVKEALGKASLAKSSTGSFKLKTEYTKNQSQFLSLQIGLKEGVRGDEKMVEVFKKGIVSELCRQNSEYRKLYQTQGEKVAPRIKLVGKIDSKGAKNVYT